MNRRTALILMTIGTCCLATTPASAEPAVKIAVREAIELASRKSGREIAEKSVREAIEQALERSAAKFGDNVLTAASDGGLELLEASAKYGDDVMKLAVEASPTARRVFALNADALLPLARRVGPEALEVEAKAPGLASRVFTHFGDDAGKIIAKSVPAEDLPRLVAYAEKADSPATRQLLLQTYQKEGKALFERIPPKLVLAGGLTATMLYGAHRVTEPAVAVEKAINGNPKAAADVAKHAVTIGALVLGVVLVLLLWRFRLMPWHGQAKKPEIPTTPPKTTPASDTGDSKAKSG